MNKRKLSNNVFARIKSLKREYDNHKYKLNPHNDLLLRACVHVCVVCRSHHKKTQRYNDKNHETKYLFTFILCTQKHNGIVMIYIVFFLVISLYFVGRKIYRIFSIIGFPTIFLNSKMTYRKSNRFFSLRRWVIFWIDQTGCFCIERKYT